MKQKGILTALLFSATILHPSYQRNNPLTQALTQFSGALTTLSQRLTTPQRYSPPPTPQQSPPVTYQTNTNRQQSPPVTYQTNTNRQQSTTPGTYHVAAVLRMTPFFMRETTPGDVSQANVVWFEPNKTNPSVMSIWFSNVTQEQLNALNSQKPLALVAEKIRKIENANIWQNNFKNMQDYTPWYAETVTIPISPTPITRQNPFIGQTKTNTKTEKARIETTARGKTNYEQNLSVSEYRIYDKNYSLITTISPQPTHNQSIVPPQVTHQTNTNPQQNVQQKVIYQTNTNQQKNRPLNQQQQSSQQVTSKVYASIKLLNPMLQFKDNSTEMLTRGYSNYIQLGMHNFKNTIRDADIPTEVTIKNIHQASKDSYNSTWDGDINITIQGKNIEEKNAQIGTTLPTEKQVILNQTFRIELFKTSEGSILSNTSRPITTIEKATKMTNRETIFKPSDGYYLKAEISGAPKKKDGQNAPSITGEIYIASLKESDAEATSKKLRSIPENFKRIVTALNVTIQKDVDGELYYDAYFIGIIQKDTSIPGTAIGSHQQLFKPIRNFDLRTQLQPDQTFTVNKYFISKVEKGTETRDGRLQYNAAAEKTEPVYLFPDEAQTPPQTTTQTETTRTESTSTSSSSAELKKYKLSAHAYVQYPNLKGEIYLGDIELGTFESNMDAKNLKNLAQSNFTERMKNSSLIITEASAEATNDYITIQIPDRQNQVNPFNLISNKEETKFTPNATYGITNPQKKNLDNLARNTRMLKDTPKKLILEFDVSEA